MLNNSSPNKITVGVVGARGYAGAELVKILAQHPYTLITGLYSSGAWDPAEALDLPTLNNTPVKKVEQLFQSNDHQVVFLATPAEVSLELVPRLLERKVLVIDLSGAFRLSGKNALEQYQQWYGFRHTALKLLPQASYGLVPLGHCNSQLIANPGCYATAISLPLIPLLKSGVIDSTHIVIDAKSGTTGAGRKLDESLLHGECAEDCIPYRVGQHQHLPEIIQACEMYAHVTPQLAMSTHLLPIRRGILASIYCQLKHLQGPAAIASIGEIFQSSYGHYPLISHAPLNQGKSSLIKLTRLTHTPRVHFAYTVQEKQLYLFSALDNLLKGAASQAVENYNLLHNWPLHQGLVFTGE